MHTEILNQAQQEILDGLASLQVLAESYLAGGTALALRHGHRRSVDFDWFREDPLDSRRLVVALDQAFESVERLPSGEHTLYVRIHGVTASFFGFPYPLLASTTPTPSATWTRRCECLTRFASTRNVAPRAWSTSSSCSRPTTSFTGLR